jgi:excisionase family DNA binding protein
MRKTASKSVAPSQKPGHPISALQPQFVSVAEAAQLLRMSAVSIRRYLGQGKLKRYKVGARTLLRHDHVMALVREV